VKRPSSRHNLVRTHRRRIGLTQTELAGLIGYRSCGHISRLERGLRVASVVEAFKLELIFGESPRIIFARVIETALTDVVKQVERLNEKVLRSGCLQPRVEYKAGRLAEVLASLRHQDHGTTDSRAWSITTIDTKDESSR